MAKVKAWLSAYKLFYIASVSLVFLAVHVESASAYVPIEWRVKYPRDMRSHGWRSGWVDAGGRVVDDYHSSPSLTVTDVLPWSSHSTGIYHTQESDRRIHANGWVIPYSDTSVCCKHGLQQTACLVMKVSDNMANAVIPYKYRHKVSHPNKTDSGTVVCPADTKIRAIRIYTNPHRVPSDPLVMSDPDRGMQRILAHELFHGLGFLGDGVHCQPDSITRVSTCPPTPYELTSSDHLAITNEYP